MTTEEVAGLGHLLVFAFLFCFSAFMVAPVMTDVTMAALCPGRDECSLAIYLTGLQQAGFLGLSGAILVQIYRTLYIDPSSFILMLAVLPTAVTLVLMYFVDVHNPNERYNKKFLDAFSLIAVTVAGYLMILIICGQIFSISSAVQSICFVVLLILVMSPIAVALKAQTPHEESISEQRTGLLREEVAEDSDNATSSTTLGGSDQDLSAGKENLNVLQAMCKLNFWLLFLAMACGMGSGLATVNNISQIGGSLGYTTKETSTLVSLWSIWNFSGRFGAGFISGHFLRQRGIGRPFFIGVTLQDQIYMMTSDPYLNCPMLQVKHVLLTSWFNRDGCTHSRFLCFNKTLSVKLFH